MRTAPQARRGRRALAVSRAHPVLLGLLGPPVREGPRVRLVRRGRLGRRVPRDLWANLARPELRDRVAPPDLRGQASTCRRTWTSMATLTGWRSPWGRIRVTRSFSPSTPTRTGSPTCFSPEAPRASRASPGHPAPLARRARPRSTVGMVPRSSSACPMESGGSWSTSAGRLGPRAQLGRKDHRAPRGRWAHRGRGGRRDRPDRKDPSRNTTGLAPHCSSATPTGRGVN